MTIRNALAFSLTVSMVVLFGLAASAGAQMMGPGMMGGYGYGGYGYQSLPAEKQAAAQKLCASHFAKTSVLRQQLIAKQAELNALIYGGKADDPKIQSLTKEISGLRAKLYEDRVALQQELAKEGIPAMGGGMYGRGWMGPGMMGPGYGMMGMGYGMMY